MSVSGNKERVTDIPICPKCRKRPSFWLLHLGDYGYDIVRLYSSEFIHKKGRPRLYAQSLNRAYHFSEVFRVVCLPRGTFHRHVFSPASEVYDEVVSMAIAFWDEMLDNAEIVFR